MILVADIDNNVCDVMCADLSNAMVLDKGSNLGMPFKGGIAWPLPYAILCEDADEALYVMSVDRVAINIYEPCALVLNLQSGYRIHVRTPASVEPCYCDTLCQRKDRRSLKLISSLSVIEIAISTKSAATTPVVSKAPAEYEIR